ncbi:hypothetical protein HDU85_000548 [Gaertneriomyces sp. JEL0708]|nr:hypothetical protein HDU85_000548 [Gaertneriomyces sp. JEL0708]
MGFGFFKSKKDSPATPKANSKAASDLRRKTSTRASAPTTPSPRFLDDSDSSTRANSFSGGDYRSLDPKLDFAATSNTQHATGTSISRGFLDDVLFDFDSKLAFDQSKPSPASTGTKSRPTREPQPINEPVTSRSKQQSSAKLQYQSAGQATTSKVYSLGISKSNVADASPRSAPVESTRRGPEDLLFAEALQLYDRATSGTARRPSSSRRPRSANRQQRDAPSPARSPVKYNRRARENPEKYMAAAIPSTEENTPTLRRSSSRGRSRGRRAVADKAAPPPTSRGRHRMQPAESSGTESEDDEDDHVPIHASLAAAAAARSRGRSASRGPRGMPMPVEPRSTSLARPRDLNRHPPAPPPSSPQTRSRSRGGRRREVDGSSSESDEEAPLVGVRIQAMEEQQQKGRRQRVVPPRQRSVEPPLSSAPSTSRSRSVDVTPGRRRNQPSNDMAPPPPQDRVTPLGHLSPQQQSMAMAQQQQMWAAFYHQAAAYQQAAYQQMQQQMGGGGGPLVPLSPMATGAAVPGMMPPAYAVLPPTTAPVRKRSLFRKRSNAMLNDSEPSVGAAIASA